MAFVFTYDSLVTAIQQEVQREDVEFLDNIPIFIALAQTRMSRELKILGTKNFSDGNLIGNTPGPAASVYPKPNRWLSNASFNIGTGPTGKAMVPILERTYDFCRLYWPDPTKVGQPKYYCDYNYNYFLIVPTPDQDYLYELGWFGFPVFIDATAQSNFFTQYASDALFYACLIEAGFFVEDERLQAWSTKYEEAKKNLLSENIARTYDAFSKGGNFNV